MRIMNVQPTTVILTVGMIDRSDKVRVVVLLDETIISIAAVARTFIIIITATTTTKKNAFKGRIYTDNERHFINRIRFCT